MTAKIRCNRIGCNCEATHSGFIGEEGNQVVVPLCYDHALENAEKRNHPITKGGAR
jgi:hypothetical protein